MAGDRGREAFQELHKATQMLDSDISALYVLEAYNYMALLLIEDEDASDTDLDLAGIYLDTLKDMALLPDDGMPSLMASLTRARLMIRRQQLEEAWGAIASVRTQLWEKKRIREWMLASLDLATVYFHQKNFPLLMKTADEMSPRFEDLQKHTQLYEALESFHLAVKQNQVTLPQLSSLRRLLVTAQAA